MESLIERHVSVNYQFNPQWLFSNSLECDGEVIEMLLLVTMLFIYSKKILLNAQVNRVLEQLVKIYWGKGEG